jgi:rSAM/selenodomain-associated transferase 2
MRSLPEAPAPSKVLALVPPQPASTEPFSVIIPTLLEERALPETLAHLNVFQEIAEVIVVDAGSNDATRAIARAAGARVLCTARGRGQQLNAGALAARNDNLLFLHADCRLPRNAFAAIGEVFARGQSAGLFAIDFGSAHPILAAMSFLSRWPSPWTEFGEGALFMQRGAYQEVGGFPDWPLMEDVEMLRRLRRAGRLTRARGTVQASPRRFFDQGVARQTLRNLCVYTLFRLGISPHRLVRLYTAAKP